jgi:hypothetical protein
MPKILFAHILSKAAVCANESHEHGPDALASVSASEDGGLNAAPSPKILRSERGSATRTARKRTLAKNILSIVPNTREQEVARDPRGLASLRTRLF